MKQLNKITSGVLRSVRLVGIPFTLTDHIDSVDKFADDFQTFSFRPDVNSIVATSFAKIMVSCPAHLGMPK